MRPLTLNSDKAAAPCASLLRYLTSVEGNRFIYLHWTTKDIKELNSIIKSDFRNWITFPHPIYDEDEAAFITGGKEKFCKELRAIVPKVYNANQLTKSNVKHRQEAEALMNIPLLICSKSVVKVLPSDLKKRISLKLNSKWGQKKTFSVIRSLHRSSNMIAMGNTFKIRIGRKNFTQQQLLENLRRMFRKISMHSSAARVEHVWLQARGTVPLDVYVNTNPTRFVKPRKVSSADPVPNPEDDDVATSGEVKKETEDLSPTDNGLSPYLRELFAISAPNK
eukprot:NODE_3203_length_1011_cov_34.442308_g3058_i0.p1 GENE.NODE_3203_length_1011_cov_34.442308_g3058_i0~~NODE_3203_length_1011_cov_34.442308_g3058_i0.p1  ORF type:complete len:300 (-),score=83.23 NODE_3203_length_1011_cov_34.442308_g3058_i0:110-946(-)